MQGEVGEIYARGREEVLGLVEQRISVAERTHAMLVEGCAGHDLSESRVCGARTLGALLAEAREDVLRWHGARDFVLSLSWETAGGSS